MQRVLFKSAQRSGGNAWDFCRLDEIYVAGIFSRNYGNCGGGDKRDNLEEKRGVTSRDAIHLLRLGVATLSSHRFQLHHFLPVISTVRNKVSARVVHLIRCSKFPLPGIILQPPEPKSFLLLRRGYSSFHIFQIVKLKIQNYCEMRIDKMSRN